MKRTKYGIGLLVMLALVVTSGTFAYWASTLGGTSDTTSGTVTIGAGAEEASTITLGAVTPTGSALIPTGQGVDGTDDTATFSVPVAWAQTTGTEFSGATGTLVVTVAYSMTGNAYTSAELDAMFSFSVTGDGAITEGAAASAVVVTVVFDTEPLDQTIYEAVINETLTVDITYTVTPD
jgi:hypothetical protein